MDDDDRGMGASPEHPSLKQAPRWLAPCGALLASAAVALSAYAARGAAAAAQSQLQLAAVFAFGHGVALAALARGPHRRIAVVALVLLLAGTLLFAGGLLASQAFDVRARSTPLGGLLLIAGWLLYAIDAWRIR
jgi:uncharacterized membrane protein YgdD (TMEM256/DUF423 family)